MTESLPSAARLSINTSFQKRNEQTMFNLQNILMFFWGESFKCEENFKMKPSFQVLNPSVGPCRNYGYLSLKIKFDLNFFKVLLFRHKG